MSEGTHLAHDRIRSADQFLAELDADEKWLGETVKKLTAMAEKYDTHEGPRLTIRAIATRARMAGADRRKVDELEGASESWRRSLVIHLQETAEACRGVSSGSLAHCIARMQAITRNAQR